MDGIVVDTTKEWVLVKTGCSLDRAKTAGRERK
jgi:hypothetical protein